MPGSVRIKKTLPWLASIAFKERLTESLTAVNCIVGTIAAPFSDGRTMFQSMTTFVPAETDAEAGSKAPVRVLEPEAVREKAADGAARQVISESETAVTSQALFPSITDTAEASEPKPEPWRTTVLPPKGEPAGLTTAETDAS